MGEALAELRPPTRAARRNQCGLGTVLLTDEAIVGARAGEIARHSQTLRGRGGHIFGAVDGEIRPAFEERFFKLFGEETDAPPFFKGPLEALIHLSRQFEALETLIRHRFTQAFEYRRCLLEGQRALSCGYVDYILFQNIIAWSGKWRVGSGGEGGGID